MKRAIDLGLVFVSAPVWAPLLGATWLAVSAKMGRPAFFSQKRGGKHGSVFEILKFRTMTDERGPDGELLPDAERLTSLGQFLRKTSLDELPSIINVIKGDMTIVGPRPFIADYLELYNETQARRHEVRPGITGWAQVNGRNTLSWEQKFEHDVWYVENQSPLLDAKIVMLTVKKVLGGDDVNAEGHATMERFEGTPPSGP